VACDSSGTGPVSGCAARELPCPRGDHSDHYVSTLVAGGRTLAGHPSGASDRRGHQHVTAASVATCAGHSPSGRWSFRKQRTVNPLIVPARYNFLYFSSRPALRPGSDTAVTGEPASPSTRHGTNLSPAGYAAPTSAGVTVQADSRSSAPWPCRCSADLGTGSRHAGHGTLAQRSDDDADATAAPTSQPRVTDNTGHQRAANAQLSRSPRPASQVVGPPRFSLGQGDSLPAARLGRLPTRQVVVVNGPHPPVQLVTIAATLERVDNTDHYRSASPQLTARIPPGAAGPEAPATVPSGARRSALGEATGFGRRPPISPGWTWEAPWGMSGA
jgi:hypothetical protein